jgi:DNA-binding GntR family transcriptional regulator
MVISSSFGPSASSPRNLRDNAFPSAAALDRSRPLGEQLYRWLRSAIVSWRLRPGDVISDSAITERFTVSRMPLREALRRLADEGLVVIRPQAGTFVAPVTRKLWEEGRLIRRALEIEGISHAAPRIGDADLVQLGDLIVQQRRATDADDFEAFLRVDDLFHAEISRLSGFERLWRIIDGAKAQVDRTRYMAAEKSHHRNELTIDEHSQIVEALAKRDTASSVRLMTEHLENSDTATMALFGSAETFSGLHQ